MTTTTMKNQNQVALTRRQFVVSSALASGGFGTTQAQLTQD